MVDDFGTLGLPPTATPDEIASAYRALARRYHPDQHPEATPAERAAWAARMAELNAAYARLSGPPPTPRASPPPAGPPARVAPSAAAGPELGRVFAWGALGVVTLLLVLVVVLVLVSAGGSDGDPPATPSTTAGPTVADWAVGNCVTGDAVLTPVPCTEANVGRIVRAVASPADCPAAAEWYAEHELRVFCIDAG